jgi:hypothetical protein
MVSTKLTFLSITDLHFNPCYDQGLIKKLATAEAKEWSGIFETSPIRKFSVYGRDTNYPLLASLFTDLTAYKEAAFILFSGDFLGHRLREKYQAGSHDNSGSGFNRFIFKTVQFLAGKFQDSFPGKVVFPAMGNDDNLCGDYEITPLGEFLNLFDEIWQPIMNRLEERSSFSRTFPVGGYYTALLPGIPGHRLVVLNNIYMSQNYRDACGKKKGDPASAQLSWFEWVLYLSRARDEKIWLIFHEPAGINMYSALHGKNPNCANNVGTFMKSGYGDRLRALLIQSSDMIGAAFCGHTHMDEFRILHDSGNRPLIYLHITPSVSPVFGNNPAYQVFSFDPVGRTLADYFTRMLNLAESPNPDTAAWETEYCFTKAYGQAALTPETMASVHKAIANDPSIRNRYIEYYAVSQPGHSLINSGNWKTFYNCIWDNTQEAFIDHYCPPHQSSLAGRKLITGND